MLENEVRGEVYETMAGNVVRLGVWKRWVGILGERCACVWMWLLSSILGSVKSMDESL